MQKKFNDAIIELLSSYNSEKHLKILYSQVRQKEISISTIKSENWKKEEWLKENEIPVVAISYLLDSYSQLKTRPDSAFTELWKAINNTYKKISINHCLINNINRNTDALGIEVLSSNIEQVKNNLLSKGTIMELIKEYAKIIHIKSLKYISNVILKGYTLDQYQVNTLLNNSTYKSINSKNKYLHDPIVNTYGQSYIKICSPTINIKSKVVELNIKDAEKSRKIIGNLSLKLNELFTTDTTTITNSNGNVPYNITFPNDLAYIDFLLRVLLYSSRNNSVHGNVVSRLNSKYVNQETLDNSIYIYFLGHLFLSLGMYVTGEIELEDLEVNYENLESLKS